MHIGSNFDGGNIRLPAPASSRSAELEIRPDPDTEFLHWFHFRCVMPDDEPRVFRIVNAGRSRTPDGWKGYRAVASYDRRTWFRLPTSFDGQTLAFELKPKHPVCYFAHFAHYTLERHAQLVAWCQTRPGVRIEVLGESVEGRPIDLVRIGSGSRAARVCWIIGGQHPGEPMSRWLVEGLLGRLLQVEDPIAMALRSKAAFYVVPNVNPDGSFQGRLRTNAAAVDLNRAWRSPDARTSPEIHCVRARMERTGVDFLLDVHGDETIPYNFVVSADAVPSMTPRVIDLRTRFERALQAANPDFQREHGYPAEEPGKADLDIGNNWVAERFGCLSMTLEQPFKDPGNAEATLWGWSPARSRKLGAAALTALAAVLDDLR
jgi:murein tripeptide amidase MpaA